MKNISIPLLLASIIALIVIAITITGCTDDPATVELISADPETGSAIEPNATITLVFDDTPTGISVNTGKAAVGGKTVTITGPFASGTLALTVTWNDGERTLTYTVNEPLEEQLTGLYTLVDALYVGERYARTVHDEGSLSLGPNGGSWRLVLKNGSTEVSTGPSWTVSKTTLSLQGSDRWAGGLNLPYRWNDSTNVLVLDFGDDEVTLEYTFRK